MAVATQLSCVSGCSNLHRNNHPWGLSRQLPLHKLYLNQSSFTSSTDSPFRRQSTEQPIGPLHHPKLGIVLQVRPPCNHPSIFFSSTARIRSEVLSPFRGSLGGLIATTQLIGALVNPSRAAEVPDIAMCLFIDIGPVSIFALLYYRENDTKNAQLARLSREENLSNLKLRVNEKRVISSSDLRGIVRLVILAGPASFISECFSRSEPYTEGLLERGVLVVPFVTGGNSPRFEFDESEEMKEITSKRKRLWQLVPVYATEWSDSWLDEQKKMAKVSPESPVYLCLRMDGRVRDSGVGYPSWNAFVAQLPPVKGIWSGLLDGMDGRVL